MQVRLITTAAAVALACAALTAPVAHAYDYTAPVPLRTVTGFDPANSVLPFPNNLLLNGTTDLTLNIPIADPTAPDAGPTQALNALDGFSTVAPWSTTFSAPIDASSLAAGDDVRVFEVELSGPGGAVTSVVRELASPDEYVVALAPSDTTGRTLAIVPTRPLQQLTSYMAVLTNGIKDSSGSPIRASLTYLLSQSANPLCTDGQSNIPALSASQACALEALRPLTNAQEAAASGAGVAAGSIALSWVATTESITPSLFAIEKVVEQSPVPTQQLVPIGEIGDLGLGLPAVAYLYVGTLDLPYYLSAPSAENPIAPLNTNWNAAPGAYISPFDQAGLDPTSTNVTFANPLPVATSTQTVPLLVTIPDPVTTGRTLPPNGWPVVIFQHGITRNRTDMFAIAGTLASQGYAVIAMDLPLHGITDTTNPFYVGNMPFLHGNVHERTFDLDLQDNTTSAPGPDGIIDPSGSHFINLTSLLTSRDNLREGVADLLVLKHAIAGMQWQFPNDGTIPNFDSSNVSFVGQSLGSIVGTMFMAVEPGVETAVLNVPGGGIARLLEASPAFGPLIKAGLAQAGLTPGTVAYDTFFVAAQTAIDSGDPINYAGNGTLLLPQTAADGSPVPGKNLLLQEVVGDGGDNPGDQVIPNTVEGAPLSGTEPLIAALGLTDIIATTQAADGIRGVARFLQGEHGSILDPTDYPATTAEMQGEMASMLVSDGHAVQVGNPSLLRGSTP